MENKSLQYSLIHTLWDVWERAFRRLAHVQPIHSDGEYLFYVSVRRFMGRPIVVDNVPLKRFDKIIELHMNNDMLFQILRESKSLVSVGVRLLKEANRALPVLAEKVAGIPDSEARVLLGITFINRSVERLGFRTFPIRSKFQNALTTWYLRKVFRMVNPNAKQMFKSHDSAFTPKMVAISRERLISLYPSQDSSSNG